LPKNGGLNYHQLFLARNAGGKLVASDIFYFLNAERMSDMLRRAWLPVAAAKMQSNPEKAKTQGDLVVASFSALQRINELVNKGQFAEALELYGKLPEAARKDKTILILRYRAAQAVSEEEYVKSIDDFRKFHPGDTALDFILIDGYALRKEYSEALKCLDRTNANVGGDPLLLVQRASLLLQMKKVPEARQAITAAIASEPDLSDPYATALDVSLADENFDETAEYLTILETRFGVAWKDLREVPAFAEFVKSPQYQKWSVRQKKK